MTEQKKLIVPNEEEKIIQIEIERLTTFKDHPFKVQEDEEMKMLIESIEKYGILNPLIVRPLKEGVFIMPKSRVCGNEIHIKITTCKEYESHEMANAYYTSGSCS